MTKSILPTWILAASVALLAGCGVAVTSEPPGAAVELVRYDLTTNPQVTRNFDGPGGVVETRFVGVTPTRVRTSGLDPGPWRLRVGAPGHHEQLLPLRAGEDEGELHVELTPK